MVEGFAHITVKGVLESVKLTPLEMANIVASRCGFSLDAEPTGNGDGWSIKATTLENNARVHVTGRSLPDACTKIIERLK